MNRFLLKKAVYRIAVLSLCFVMGLNVPVQAEAEEHPDRPFDFSFVWMSDTQYYSESYPEIYNSIVNWTALHQSDQNIKYVIHTGDIVNHWNEDTQWEKADLAMKVLDGAKIPYGVLAGNHDVGEGSRTGVNYYKWFGAGRFKKNGVFGKSYDNNKGHYDLINAGAEKLIVVYMGWGVGSKEISWMNKVLAKNKDRKAILAFHEYLLADGTRSPVADRIYKDVVVPNRNVFAVLCGHYHNSQLKVDELDDNHDGHQDRKVFQMLADYQEARKGGEGFIRLLQFDLKQQKVFVKTYSPYLDRYNYYSPAQYPAKDEFTIDL
ncbi:metallophosphoesterase [Paenibacillus pinistramenti]|uniref:metallophosphoesterase n=1 Tax=Paenibacillus pinistramenti TaxID=1768003 RepID=UPI001107A6E5|nr:metallophosphoesterase [Paenibacillus pinistramenti]